MNILQSHLRLQTFVPFFILFHDTVFHNTINAMQIIFKHIYNKDMQYEIKHTKKYIVTPQSKIKNFQRVFHKNQPLFCTYI